MSATIPAGTVGYDMAMMALLLLAMIRLELRRGNL